MELPSELKEARNLFKEAENAIDPKKKARLLEDALDFLEDYQRENPDVEQYQSLIEHLRQSHTRRLLSQLFQMENITFAIWFKYILLLASRLKAEVQEITGTDVQIQKKYYEFVDIWRKELLDVLEK